MESWVGGGNKARSSSVIHVMWTTDFPMQEDLFLDTNWKPKVNLSDLSKNGCPCPQEYLDVSFYGT